MITDADRKANIKAVTVKSTPLIYAVKVEFEDIGQDGYVYSFTALDESLADLNTGYLSYFAWKDEPVINTITRGYAPMEALPDTMYIQVVRMDASGKQEKVGEPLALKLK